MNKRDFLVGSAGAALATAALATPEAPRAAGSTATPSWARTQRHPDLVAAPCAEHFQAYVGETFTLRDGALRLAEVRRLPGTPGHEQFTLRFEPVSGTAPAAGLHELSHATGQRLALRLDAGERTLDAHFSLLA